MESLNTTTSKPLGHLGHDHAHGRPHVTKLINEEVSQLAPYAGLILTISIVIYFLARYYVFEGFLLRRFYGKIYLDLNDNQRRGFINHHVAATAKIIMLVSAAYPFLAVVAGSATLHTPYAGSKIVTLGDVLLVINQVFIAMYLFELIFREKLSCVAVLHHIGSVTIAASAVTISLDWKHQHDATIEFILCYVWGMFDVIAEFWPHVAIILYRMRPNDHNYLRKVFLFAGMVTFLGTITETIAVMYLWGWAWDRWTLAFRVVTPILHVVFSCAQLWGAYNFYKMWKRQKKLLREQKPDVELSINVKTMSVP
ncbi:hypothetical protein BKA66DRAFT_77351 [Pyrenochaeta sp. MPI-SDFR-AT-0127]|nr:hypothetical protein BKA66DRAFT_77351 [Pyrenochaeta sp. MPI-SDFR-AT-0127]